MKHYFDFFLTGKKFLSVWLPFYLIVLVPYFVLIFFCGKKRGGYRSLACSCCRSDDFRIVYFLFLYG